MVYSFKKDDATTVGPEYYAEVRARYQILKINSAYISVVRSG